MGRNGKGDLTLQRSIFPSQEAPGLALQGLGERLENVQPCKNRHASGHLQGSDPLISLLTVIR